jgi:hypothetical protein
MNEELDCLHDMLVVTLSTDGQTITFADPDAPGEIPVDMSFGTIKIVYEGNEILVDSPEHPVVYTMVTPGVVGAFLVGREWSLGYQDYLDAFKTNRTDCPVGLILAPVKHA